MSIPSHRPRSSSRRTFLAATGASTVAAGTLWSGGPARADTSGVGAGFAMVTDTHVNLEHPDRIADLARVMEHIETRNPAFVVNCGDVTDHGVDAEFQAYLACIPDALKSRVHDVPGNHEIAWNSDNEEAYRRDLGPTRQSFDAYGLHVVGVDPLVSQEGVYRFGAHLLDWLDRDLGQVSKSTPIVIFNHFPLAGRSGYVPDKDDFLRLIAPYNVRLLLSGHEHRLRVQKFNGATGMVGNGVINGPIYYWGIRRDGADGAYLEISEVHVPDGGPVTERVVANAPLTDPGPGGDLGPYQTKTVVGSDSLAVRVDVPPSAAVAGVQAQLWPQRAKAKPWMQLDGASGRWTGTVDISYLPPGVHRLSVQAQGADGAGYDDTSLFEIPATTARVGWTHQLSTARIQGDLAERDGLVVAADVEGRVRALRVRPQSCSPVWHTKIGGVFKGAVFSPDGTQVLVPSVDHHLYALDAATGRTMWRTDFGAPLECELTVAIVGNQPRLFTAAGERLFCLDLDGMVQWRADLGGIYVGEAGCDGDRVFAGSGDGNLYAFDALTGARLWRASCTDQPGDYGRLIYGPWAAQIRFLPSGDLLVGTFTTFLALDPATGAVRWAADGFHSGGYTPPTVTDYGALVFDGKFGDARLLDVGTGAVKWSAAVLPRSKGAGPVATTDPAVYWMAANSGLLVRFDLAAQKASRILQISTAFSFSTAVLVGSPGDEVLVTAAKDGIIRGVVDLDKA